MSGNRIQRYITKHGHGPRARLACGARQRITVTVNEGYVEIRQLPSGAHLYIPSDVWITLLKWIIPLTRLMDAENPFDVDMATHSYLENEAKRDADLRQLKKQLYGNRSKKRRRS